LCFLRKPSFLDPESKILLSRRISINFGIPRRKNQAADLTADDSAPPPAPAPDAISSSGRSQRAGKKMINYAADPYGGMLHSIGAEAAEEDYDAPQPVKKATKTSSKSGQTSKVAVSTSTSSSSRELT